MDDENQQTPDDVPNDASSQDVDIGVNMDGGGATSLNAAPNVPARTAVNTTETTIGSPGGMTATLHSADAIGAALIQELRERRLITLALADQVGEDRWRLATLPHDRSLHNLLAALLAWDEWAAAVFEMSLLRALPPRLIALTQAAEARHSFEARAMARYAPLGRADLLASLQAAGERAISGAIGVGAPGWHGRHIAGLAFSAMRRQAPEDTVQSAAQTNVAAHDGSATEEPTVGDILRWLMAREARRDAAISAELRVNADIEQLRARFTREGA